MFLGFRSLPIRRPTLLIIRSIVGGHDRSYDRSYDRSFMATTSRTIFSNRCWSRDHAYDQSYDDLPPGRKTDRSMRSLLAIVANIADRSHVRQIATDRTINQSYDPVWQWLNDIDRRAGSHAIPGWNEHAKSAHALARDAFKCWTLQAKLDRVLSMRRWKHPGRILNTFCGCVKGKSPQQRQTLSPTIFCEQHACRL